MNVALSNDRHVMAEELRARLNVHFVRALKAASLRWLALASFPIWIQARWGILADLLAFWALLAQGACFALAVVFAGLEHRWQRRAEQLDGAPAPIVHVAWSDLERLRSALWWALAVVSMVPWGYVALDRTFPAALREESIAVAVTVFLLLVVAETLPRLRKRDTTR
jgi:hypothetical protein